MKNTTLDKEVKIHVIPDGIAMMISLKPFDKDSFSTSLSDYFARCIFSTALFFQSRNAEKH